MAGAGAEMNPQGLGSGSFPESALIWQGEGTKLLPELFPPDSHKILWSCVDELEFFSSTGVLGGGRWSPLIAAPRASPYSTGITDPGECVGLSGAQLTRPGRAVGES